MKTKLLVLTGLFFVLAVVLSGCATGLTAAGWPAMTADANNVYLSGGSYVYAVNLQTGAQVWRFPEKATANPFEAKPLLTSDGQLVVGGYDKKLYGLDLLTGKSNWQYADAHDRWIGGVLEANKMLYAPNADYKLYALNLHGQLQWTFEADQSIWGVPVSDGINIYFGSLGKKMYAVNALTGKQVWVQKLDGAVLGSPVLGADKTLYVGSYGGTVYALNTATGAAKSIATASSWIWSGPALAGNMLYFGDGKGSLYGHSISGTDPSWTQSLSGAITATPLVSGDNVIVGTEAGNLYFIDKKGQNLRPITISGKVYASPIAAGGLILVAPNAAKATDPILVAIDATGAATSIKWSFIPVK
jgi:eukaryotic-like serine/threonine-protein kinase